MELSEEQKKQLQAQKAQCPFCKIVAGEIPAQKVYEDEKVLAILDINPFREGHTLVLPKEHYPIMPLLPEEEFQYLFDLVPEMTKYLREAMVVPDCYVYIANGAAAGQQAGHFMIHLIPSTGPIDQFSPGKKEIEQKGFAELKQVLEHNLPLMMRDRASEFPLDADDNQDQGVRLAELLEENPDFKQTLIDNPDVIRAGIQENPSLQELFDGVDIDALSEKLKQAQGVSEPEVASQQTETPPSQMSEAAPNVPEPSNQKIRASPTLESSQEENMQASRAVDMSDDQLRTFIDSKQKLKELLLTDQETLTAAIAQQEKLQTFFENTSVQEVLSRYQQDTPQSLEDLAQ